MKAEPIRLFRTLAHPCGYFHEREAENLVLEPESPRLRDIFPGALAQGYRRAGAQIYRPDCAKCNACKASRIVVDRFLASRNHKRILKRNQDVQCSIEVAQFQDDYFDLYQTYLSFRHAGGGMDDAEQADFQQFLFSPWSPTRFLVFREAGKLLMVAVTDVTRVGLSAVYTFYQPDLNARSLGTLAILSQISLARSMQLPHLYLGYWIKDHAKMHYKSRFRPLEILQDSHWVSIENQLSETGQNQDAIE